VTLIQVYLGTVLAAAFDYGCEPAYHGAHGQQVRALVEAPHAVYNPQVDETAPCPKDQGPGWWAANIHSAGLAAAGFRVVATQRPD
jgi:hypothetical protein